MSSLLHVSTLDVSVDCRMVDCWHHIPVTELRNLERHSVERIPPPRPNGPTVVLTVTYDTSRLNKIYFIRNLTKTWKMQSRNVKEKEEICTKSLLGIILAQEPSSLAVFVCLAKWQVKASFAEPDISVFCPCICALWGISIWHVLCCFNKIS